jgi:spore germination cell wall hydrolase CwlJ-like protein
MWTEFDKCSASLCAWREARGEGRDGIRAVLHVIDNRAKAQNKSWAEIVYAKLQFSSMTYGEDPQLAKVPVSPDAAFDMCCSLADAVMAGRDVDLTAGATHYFADYIPMPSWAVGMKFTGQIGRQRFYK